MKATALFFLICTPILYGFLAVLIKRATLGIPPFAAIAISMFFLFSGALVLSFLFERDFVWSVQEHSLQYSRLAVVGLVNIVCFWFFIKAVHSAEVWQQQMFDLLKPVFAAVFGMFLLSESISLNLFAGLAIMSLGLYVAVR